MYGENLIQDKEALDAGYKVHLVNASTSKGGTPIGTFFLRLPRRRLVEMNTHCAFARNARSTRAVPTRNFIEEVLSDPAMPIYIGKNQAGMVSSEEVDDLEFVRRVLLDARFPVIDAVMQLEGTHKQFINNLLEFWMWTTQIVTTSMYGLDNFLKQRSAEAGAAPEMAAIQGGMKVGRELMIQAPIRKWHIPFILPEEESLSLSEQLCISIGRCASYSYYSPGRKGIDYRADIDRVFNRLLANDPRHESPFEHQAIWTGYPNARFAKFTGWCSVRTLMGGNHYRHRLVFNRDPLQVCMKIKEKEYRVEDFDKISFLDFAIGASPGYWYYEGGYNETPKNIQVQERK